MDANSTGLRGLLDVVKSNRLMSTGVIGFLLLMAVMAVIDGGISMMPLILATCAVGTAAVFFWQAGSYRVDIYENGLEIFGGVLTRAGVYLYKDIESIDIEDTTYRLFGVFPVLKYTTVSIQGKNDLWTQLSSFNFTDLKVKINLKRGNMRVLLDLKNDVIEKIKKERMKLILLKSIKLNCFSNCSRMQNIIINVGRAL